MTHFKFCSSRAIFWTAVFAIFAIFATTEAQKTCSSASEHPKSCSEIQYIFGSNASYVQRCFIYPHGNETSLQVLCDLETDYGGWTIFQRRSSGPRDEFDRLWDDYAQGFGSLDGNFWLGLDNIHVLTRYGVHEMRIEMEDWEGEKRYAKYSDFTISDASDDYRLGIQGYFGSSGDSMANGEYNTNNGMRFTTKDRDNSMFGGCADVYVANWWANNCGWSGLNGLYHEKGEPVFLYNGLFWFHWTGDHYSLAKTEMKVRRRK